MNLVKSEQDLNKSLGRRIRIHRIQKNKTIVQLAEDLGFSKSKISKIELGIHPPKPIDLLRLAEYFKIPISQLFMEAELDTEKILEKMNINNSYNLEDQLRFSLEMSIRSYLKYKGIKNPEELERRTGGLIDAITKL